MKVFGRRSRRPLAISKAAWFQASRKVWHRPSLVTLSLPLGSHGARIRRRAL